MIITLQGGPPICAREVICIAIILVVITAAFFAPLLNEINAVLPAEPFPADINYHIWLYEWLGHALAISGPAHLYEANIFYPARHTVAFSDIELGNAFLYSLFKKTAGTMTGSFNLVVIANVFFDLAGILPGRPVIELR